VDAAATSLEQRGQPLVIRPPSRWVGFGLRELWRFHELLFFLAWRDLKVRYKQTFLGASWAILQPIMYMVVFTLFFGRVAHLFTPKLPYALVTLSGSVIWLFFANSVQFAANSLVGNAALITKVYFPRLLGVVAPVLAGLVDLLLAFGVLLVIMAAYGFYPDARIVFAIPFVLLTMGTAVGVGAYLAALNVKYRDVRYVVPFLLQLWLFASPVAYVTDLVHGSWQTVYYLNPMAGAVAGFRWALLGGVPPTVGQVLVSTASGGVMMVGGILYFRRKEQEFADIV
jgi:lipopolysaccharide transport system permease protein